MMSPGQLKCDMTSYLGRGGAKKGGRREIHCLEGLQLPTQESMVCVPLAYWS
jgi:hypothetical protein